MMFYALYRTHKTSVPRSWVAVKLQDDDDGEHVDLLFDEVAPMIPDAKVVDKGGKPLHESSLAD